MRSQASQGVLDSRKAIRRMLYENMLTDMENNILQHRVSGALVHDERAASLPLIHGIRYR
jgi:hypothetical protein